MKKGIAEKTHHPPSRFRMPHVAQPSRLRVQVASRHLMEDRMTPPRRQILHAAQEFNPRSLRRTPSPRLRRARRTIKSPEREAKRE